MNENTINDPRLNVAPYLSNECKTYIESLLLMGVTVDMVYDKYIEDPSNVGILSRRDEYMTRKDMVNAWKRVRCRRSQKHFDDAMSMNLWHAEERDIFFYYQRPNGTTVPFIMGLQTPWMCERMVQHSHNSIISMDSTFATNKYGVEPFYKHKRKLQKSGFLTNFKKERHLLTVVERAKSIPDTDCLAITPDCNQLWVRSQTTRSTWYLVRQCGALDVCECAWAIRGNTC
ncbi:hypothetical protein KI387_043097, partial [Taxus chinensis]